MLGRLRIAATTAAAVASGVFNVALGRGERRPVVLAPGDLAPDFALMGSDGHEYRLSEYTGRAPVVLAWFPKAFTGGCTIECKSLGESRQLLKASGAQYFGASVDTTAANRRFAASLSLDFPILSDPGRQVARAYGVLGPSGFASRWTFYIGVDRRIADIDTHVRSATHGADIAARLRALKL